ncbi:calcium-binding protein [Streptomyces sp. URMC 129]|uniref:calcium-binding protein n=1 Tax=Streptomyces sp. URMC 129 TaxID=3423407 RepID=UPI003F194725
MRKRVIALGVAALAAGGQGWFAAPAQAATRATVSSEDLANGIVYVAGDGQRNDVTFTTTDGWHYTVEDRVPIVAGEGCEHPDAQDPYVVRCVISKTPDTSWVSVDLGDGDDRFRIEEPTLGEVRGGSGNDTLTGVSYQTMYGDAGNDRISHGGTMLGGTGDDTLVITSATGGKARGEDGSDTVHGGPGPDDITGGPRHDVVYAGGGADKVYGNGGRDTLSGGTGDDTLSGGLDPDVLYGNSGNDVLYGGAGTDTLSGGPGTDRIHQD